LKIAATSAATASLTNREHNDEHEEEGAGKSSPAKDRKKRKRKRSADEIDVLFDGVVGRKLVRGALDTASEPASASALPKKTKTKEGGGHSKDMQRHANLEAVVDAIRVAPSGEGKKRSKRRHS
jgi:hypothetical protein